VVRDWGILDWPYGFGLVLGVARYTKENGETRAHTYVFFFLNSNVVPSRVDPSRAYCLLVG
jgi:hypothetical protein